MNNNSFFSELVQHRPFVITANSSWYLYHYRSLLLSTLRQSYIIPIALVPYDSTSKYLSKHSLHIPWQIRRRTAINPFALVVSFLRALSCTSS